MASRPVCNTVDGTRTFVDRSTEGSNTAKTETYGSAITPPSSRSVATLNNGRASSSYISSVAAAGASRAYAQGSNPASSTPVPPPTSVQFDTKTYSSNSVVVTSTVMADNAAVHVGAPTMLCVVVATVLLLASGARML